LLWGLGVATDGLLAFGGELGLAVLALVEITRAVDAFAGWMMTLGKRPTGDPPRPPICIVRSASCHR
jgi:hypothetical protein